MKAEFIGIMIAVIILAVAIAGCTTQPPAEQPTPTPTQVYTPGSTTVVTATTPAPVPLVGTTWHLVSFNNGVIEAENVIPGTGITAVFGADGNLAGSGGCNQYFATYALGEGNAIGIGTPGSTLMICQSPTGVDNQEQLYLAMLDGVESYSIDGNLLSLMNNQKHVIATYSTAPAAA